MRPPYESHTIRPPGSGERVPRDEHKEVAIARLRKTLRNELARDLLVAEVRAGNVAESTTSHDAAVSRAMDIASRFVLAMEFDFERPKKRQE